LTEPLSRLKAALADRYRIEFEIGSGGMATVYLAQDLKHDRKVAVKVLRPELAAVLGAERFLSEIKTTANLQHPHILALFDSGEADGFLFYVMPYVEGESLRDRLTKHGELPLTDAVRILRDVADAMAAAHAKGVVHRDIKPSNLMVREGRLFVVDVAFAAVRPSPWRQAVDLANMMLVLGLVAGAEDVYERARDRFTDDELAEAFAASRSVTIPGQLRARLRSCDDDLVARFRALAPARPRVKIQRWSLRRLALTVWVLVVATLSFAALTGNLTEMGLAP